MLPEHDSVTMVTAIARSLMECMIGRTLGKPTRQRRPGAYWPLPGSPRASTLSVPRGVPNSGAGVGATVAGLQRSTPDGELGTLGISGAAGAEMWLFKS